MHKSTIPCLSAGITKVDIKPWVFCIIFILYCTTVALQDRYIYSNNAGNFHWRAVIREERHHLTEFNFRRNYADSRLDIYSILVIPYQSTCPIRSARLYLLVKIWENYMFIQLLPPQALVNSPKTWWPIQACYMLKQGNISYLTITVKNIRDK